MRPSIADRDADRSGAPDGTLDGFSFQSSEPAVFDCLGGVDPVTENPGDVTRVYLLGDGIGALLGEFLLDAARILNGAVSTPLEGGHWLGDLQPLCGSVDQLGERAGAIGPRGETRSCAMEFAPLQPVCGGVWLMFAGALHGR